jgi:glyoxylase-like metal-dependent hydrolase (beta-lactamase superfamily II)
MEGTNLRGEANGVPPGKIEEGANLPDEVGALKGNGHDEREMTMFQLETFYDPATFTLTYLVYDPATRDAVVIDPVLDYDPLASQTSTTSADKLIAFVEAKNLKLLWVLETHAHADHLSSSQYLKTKLGARVAIGERIREVQATFKTVLDLPEGFRTDGHQFDRLLKDGETLEAGSLRIGVIPTPGHTPACVTFQLEDAIFTGDALFMEDYGTGRCDFPRGNASDLYTSVHDRLYTLPDATRVFVGHDYQPDGRPLKYETTIGASKRRNIQLKQETPREEFVSFRNARDATLKQPRLLFPSVQVNVDAGRLPSPRGNGIRYLHLPLNLKHPTRDDGSS